LNDIKERFWVCLDNAKSAGLFAHHDILKDAPNPGLFIRGFGIIGFLLREIDIQTIMAASRQSSADNTTVRTESAPVRPRKPLLVPGSSVEIQNPSWATLLRSILGQVSTKLGIEASGNGMAARLSALILYESGSEFTAPTSQV
jgi:hypothetical protein